MSEHGQIDAGQAVQSGHANNLNGEPLLTSASKRQTLLSQLLGLGQDQSSHGAFGGAQGHPHNYLGASSAHPALGQNSQSTAPGGWNGALQSVKLSDALQGINITSNFMWLVLFVGLTAWLGVVYWVRHHEPFANNVLGNGAAQSMTAAADRQLVAGICRTLPVRTAAKPLEFYVPVPNGNQVIGSGRYSSAPAFASGQQQSVGLPLPPLPPMPSPQPSPTPLNNYRAAYQLGVPQADNQPDTARHAYMVPIQGSGGTRVKMIVNR